MRRVALGVLLAGTLAFVALLPVRADDKKTDTKSQEKKQADKKDKDKDWVPLFNGKDLKGWKVYPEGTGEWKVEDGILIGSGKASHLFSDRGDYQNFRYRVEAMINDHGNSGQYFRTQFGAGFPKGYEAQINSTHGDKIRTGSLYPSFDGKLSPELKDSILVLEQLHKPDEWFSQEVIAEGNRI